MCVHFATIKKLRGLGVWELESSRLGFCLRSRKEREREESPRE